MLTGGRIRQLIALRLAALAAGLFVATLSAALADSHWVLELFSHFVPWYFGGALLLAAAFAALRRLRWAVLCMALAAWHAVPIAGFFADTPELRATDPRRTLTVFHFNAGLDHPDPQRIVHHVLAADPAIDVVVIVEAASVMAPALDGLKQAFPHQIRELIDSPFGIALASRLPFDSATVSRRFADFPHIEARIRLPEREAPLALLAIHPPPPISREFAGARNLVLDHVATVARGQAARTPVVVGDFNLSPWSSAFARFAAGSGLQAAFRPWRFDTTWPVIAGIALPGIAIDHSFLHPGIAAIERRIGPELGSDHLPVTITLGY